MNDLSKDAPPPYRQEYPLDNEQQSPPPGPSQQTTEISTMNDMSKDAPASAPPPSYEEASRLVNQPQPPPPAPGTHTVYVLTPINTIPLAFGPRPMRLCCPFCHQTMNTSIKIEANTNTHLIAALLCVLGCWPCFYLPYIIDDCQSKKHYCRNCKAYLGVYSG